MILKKQHRNNIFSLFFLFSLKHLQNVLNVNHIMENIIFACHISRKKNRDNHSLPVPTDLVHTLSLVLTRIWVALIGVDFTPTSFKSCKIDEMVMDQQTSLHPENVRTDDNKGPSECHFNGTSSPYSISHLPAPGTEFPLWECVSLIIL